MSAKLFEQECANPSTTHPVAVQARKHAADTGANIAQSLTAKAAGIQRPRGTVGEYKTDILFGNATVSVKQDGAVQLSSAEGKTSANMFRAVDNSFPPEQRATFAAAGLTNIIKGLQSMPIRSVANQNIQRVLREQPSTRNWNSKNWFLNGKLLPQYDLDLWMSTVGNRLENEIENFLETHPLFTHRLIEEALTGRYTMTGGQDIRGAATHILTPYYYKLIDNNYIRKVVNDPSLRVRISAKSRKGVSSSTMRIDYEVTDSA